MLLLILMTNQFAQVLGDAASNLLPKEAVFLVMGLTSVQYLTILIPIGLFLAIMLSLGRLYRDSEMAALMACGIGPGGLTLADNPLAASAAAGDRITLLVRLQQPYVDPAHCIGCGICEHECPVKGRRAIRVTAENETRERRHRFLL